MFSYNEKTMNRIVNMRMLKKKLETLSRNCEKDAKKSMTQCKTAMAKGDVERTRLYGSYVVEKREEGLQYLRQSFMVDSVMRNYQKMVTNGSVTRSMDMLAMEMGKEFNAESTMALALRMEKMKDYDDYMKVQVELASKTSTGMSKTEGMDERIDDVLKQVADENHIELQKTFLSVTPSTVTAIYNVHEEEADIASRLERLKQ